MDVNNEAALGGGEQQPVTQISVDGEGTLSVTEAARALAGARHKQKDQPQPSEPREGAAPHEVAQESTPAQAGNDAGELLAPPRRDRACRSGRPRTAAHRPSEVLDEGMTRISSRASLAIRN